MKTSLGSPTSLDPRALALEVGINVATDLVEKAVLNTGKFVCSHTKKYKTEDNKDGDIKN